MATALSEIYRLRTYPWFLAVFCVFLFCTVAYQAWQGDVSTNATILGLGIPAFFISVLTRVSLEIDPAKKLIQVKHRNLFRSDTKRIPFSDIKRIALDTGKGFFSNSGVVTVWTEDDAINVTAMGIMQAGLPREWESEIRSRISL